MATCGKCRKRPAKHVLVRALARHDAVYRSLTLLSKEYWRLG
jgi:hypothetical protein